MKADIYSNQLGLRGGVNRNERPSLNLVNAEANEICNKPENTSTKSI